MIDKDYLACSGIENSKVKPEDCCAILHVIKKGPFMTLYQMKIKIGQPVEHLSTRTNRRIILDSGRPACVSSRVLALTQEMKIGRVACCKRMMRKKAFFRKDIVSKDEVYFSTKVTTGKRLVCQLQGVFSNWRPPEFAKCWPVSN